MVEYIQTDTHIIDIEKICKATVDIVSVTGLKIFA